MEKIFCSFIVPMYNSAEFMDRCVMSIINQTDTDWELLIYNDGSKDNTLEKANRYAAMCDKIKVIDGGENKGVGIARKVLIDNAQGEFIVSVDSDDYLESNFLAINRQLQAQHNADIVYTKIGVVYPQGMKEMPNMNGEYLLEREGTVQCYFSSTLKFLTGKLIRRSLCSQVEWSERRIAEDVNTLFYLMYKADKVRVSEVSVYRHVFREGSLLANAPQFLCVCGSGVAEMEIIKFCYKEGNLKIAKFLLERTIKNFKQIKKEIKKGTFQKTYVQKYAKWFNELKNEVEGLKNKKMFKEILNYQMPEEEKIEQQKQEDINKERDLQYEL